ncbi:hypothetical protein GCM10008955_27720 [Deinococcus malanensis]|uniref:Uncharacterized protein n=1 Tax=Deinococcus malanensis TaxID=1706855 RepID=A0ABQ2EY94_9DEIO|nr:hypothetical protein GCM10008955_27720 [Deinococcus malanensis]
MKVRLAGGGGAQVEQTLHQYAIPGFGNGCPCAGGQGPAWDAKQVLDAKRQACKRAVRCASQRRIRTVCPRPLWVLKRSSG